MFDYFSLEPYKDFLSSSQSEVSTTSPKDHRCCFINENNNDKDDNSNSNDGDNDGHDFSDTTILLAPTMMLMSMRRRRRMSRSHPLSRLVSSTGTSGLLLIFSQMTCPQQRDSTHFHFTIAEPISRLFLSLIRITITFAHPPAPSISVCKEADSLDKNQRLAVDSGERASIATTLAASEAKLAKETAAATSFAVVSTATCYQGFSSTTESNQSDSNTNTGGNSGQPLLLLLCHQC